MWRRTKRAGEAGPWADSLLHKQEDPSLDPQNQREARHSSSHLYCHSIVMTTREAEAGSALEVHGPSGLEQAIAGKGPCLNQSER